MLGNRRGASSLLRRIPISRFVFRITRASYRRWRGLHRRPCSPTSVPVRSRRCSPWRGASGHRGLPGTSWVSLDSRTARGKAAPV